MSWNTSYNPSMTYLDIQQHHKPNHKHPFKNLLFTWFNEVYSREITANEYYLQIPGMSGKKYRYLMNKISSSLEEARYLEIGSWKGSTLCSVLSNNRVQATAIDNWSQFDGPRDEFFANVDKTIQLGTQLTVLEKDFRSIDYSTLGKFNMYLFDGPHTAQDQYDGLMMAQPALDPDYLLVVDDWNWPPAREGTHRALRELGAEVSYITIMTTPDGSHPNNHSENSDWHNGYFLAAVSKKA